MVFHQQLLHKDLKEPTYQAHPELLSRKHLLLNLFCIIRSGEDNWRKSGLPPELLKDVG